MSARSWGRTRCTTQTHPHNCRQCQTTTARADHEMGALAVAAARRVDGDVALRRLSRLSRQRPPRRAPPTRLEGPARTTSVRAASFHAAIAATAMRGVPPLAGWGVADHAIFRRGKALRRSGGRRVILCCEMRPFCPDCAWQIRGRRSEVHLGAPVCAWPGGGHGLQATECGAGHMVVLCVAASAQQSASSAIVRQVTDTTQSGLPGATVTVTNVGTGAARTAVTDGDGRFSVPGCWRQYAVKVSRPDSMTEPIVEIETIRLRLHAQHPDACAGDGWSANRRCCRPPARRSVKYLGKDHSASCPSTGRGGSCR